MAKRNHECSVGESAEPISGAKTSRLSIMNTPCQMNEIKGTDEADMEDNSYLFTDTSRQSSNKLFASKQQPSLFRPKSHLLNSQDTAAVRPLN